MANILIGGDVSPIGRAAQFFVNGDAESIFNDVLPEFADADLSVINLECCFIPPNGSPIIKDGPALGVPRGTIKGIRAAGIDIDFLT